MELSQIAKKFINKIPTPIEDLKPLSPGQVLEMLGTKEEFEELNPFQDEEHNELLDEKLNQEFQDENREEVKYES